MRNTDYTDFQRRITQIFLSAVICIFYLRSSAFTENKVITDVKKWEYIETEHFKKYIITPSVKNFCRLFRKYWKETFNNTTRFYEYRPSKKLLFLFIEIITSLNRQISLTSAKGTGGVTEAFKNRFIVYNDGSVRWLRNVIPHEFAICYAVHSSLRRVPAS